MNLDDDTRGTLLALLRADGAPFTFLADIAHLDPSVHFRHADLSGVDFAGSDLTGYDFSGAVLTGASFRDARIDNTIFNNADLAEVIWPADWQPTSRGGDQVLRQPHAPMRVNNGRAGKPEVRIFVSYSHQDRAALEKLRTHLAPWRRDGVTVWYDENIEPGAALSTEIGRELRRAHIFVALFSPAYIDSHYCWDIEYKRAMSRRARKLMRVVAVVVKPCGWKQTRAAGFKLLPKDGVPPEGWSSSDAAYANVVQGIGEVIKAVRRELTAEPATSVRGVSKPSLKPKPRPKSPKSASAGSNKMRPASTAKPRAPSRKGTAKR